MTARTRLGYQVGTLGFVHLATLVRLARHLNTMSPRRLPRVALLGLFALAGLPLQLAEAIWWGRRIRRTRLAAPPVFIIGHWRSGTTHLHNLMAQDRRFGFVSMYQAIVPSGSLVGGRPLERLLARVVPERRPMDAMVWPTHAPQEEEIPLAKTLPYAFYVQFLFPRKARALFRRYVLLEGAPRRAVAEWKRKYLRVLRVATIHAGGRRLLLKNPVNTARVRLLLELFPDAKFVHIHRSPYDVFPSTRNLHRSLLAFTSLQEERELDADEAVYGLYEDMMRRYLAERRAIPEGNLVDVRFDDLEADPLGTLRRIYACLDLPGFADAEPAFRAYVNAQAGYRKNGFRVTPAEAARIERRWGFAFEAFGYRTAAATSSPAASATHLPYCA